MAKFYLGNQRSLKEFICIVLILGSIQAALDPKVSLPLSTLPAELRLTSVIPAGVEKSTCAGLWFKTGYVCDKAKTIAYAKNDQNKLIQEELTFKTTIENFLKAWNLAEVDYIKTQKQMTASQSKKSHQYLIDQLQKLKTDSAACWTLMRTYRSNSLCATCSASNYQYYKDKLLGLGQSDCTRFVEVCHPFFMALHVMKDAVSHTFAQFLTSARNGVAKADSKYTSVYNSFNANIGTIRELVNLASQQRFYTTSQKKQDADKAAAKICENVLVIHNVPVLFQLTVYLQEGVAAFVTEYAQATGRRLGLESLAAKSRALCGLVPGATSLGAQEIKVVADSTVEASTDSVKPASMSLSFF